MSRKYLLLFSLITIFLFVLFIPKISKAAVNHVVISQIQIIGATATDEFVELYNPTGEVVDLTGFRLSKKVSSGTQSNLIASMSGTISPNSYLLLGHTNYVGGIAKDKTYSTSSITNDNVVILYSDAGQNVIDKVGFGTAYEFETSPFNLNPPENQSIRRINNQDTDNNLNDFELLTTSSPRNSTYILATVSPIPQSTSEPTEMPTASPSPTPSPTVSPTIAPPSPTATAEPATATPTLLPSPNPTQTPIKVDEEHDHHKDHHYIKFRFARHEYECGFERHEIEISRHHFNYFKFRFWRR